MVNRGFKPFSFLTRTKPCSNPASDRIFAMTTDHSLEVPRAAAAVALSGVALIHLLELQTKLREVPYLGVGYLALIIGCVAAGSLLVHRNSPLGWRIAGLSSLGALVGYSLTRTTGLPLSHDDIGNWLEPMGLASLCVESVVVLLAAYALGYQARTRQASAPGQLQANV